MQLPFTHLSRIVALTAALAVVTVYAVEPAAAPRKPASPHAEAAPASPAPGHAPGGASIHAERGGVPHCLRKLELTPEQVAQIEEIVRDYDTDLSAVWKQFGGRYMAAVQAEAMLLSAIEDNLTEEQRTQVREQRRRVAQHEKKLAAAHDASATTDKPRATADGPQTPLDKPNAPTAKPASAVEQELAIVGVSLTPEQEAIADKVQEKYLSRLRTLNREIQGLHTRLVSLEADKFVEIEKVLTEAQLKQLWELRQAAPPATEDDEVASE